MDFVALHIGIANVLTCPRDKLLCWQQMLSQLEFTIVVHVYEPQLIVAGPHMRWHVSE